MPINPKLSYNGQRWAWPASIAIIVASVALWNISQPSGWLPFLSWTLMGFWSYPVIFRLGRMGGTFRKMIEDSMAENIGRALIESNLEALKLPRKMPSEILEEAISGVQKEG